MPVFLNPRGFKNALGEYPSVDVPSGWPAGHLIARPNDKLGQQIIDYVVRWKNHPAFPPSPWDDRRGEIFLRDLDEPEAPDDEEPLYRVKAPTAFVGCTLYAQGALVPFSGWVKNMSAVEPANESARRVFSYATSYGPGRNLTAPPYQAGRLHFENPALFGSPQSATPRWVGNSAA
jgi:hypothetical protein